MKGKCLMEIFLNYFPIFVIILLSFAVLHLLSSLYAAHCIYVATLKRKTKEQWSREYGGENEIQEKMFSLGREWQKYLCHLKKDVHIVNDGLNLYGEYYDNGQNKAVLILSGRTDTLKYGYYFARPYWNMGYSVLVIDSRAHGESDGVYNTVGFEEGKDAVEWIKFLNKEMKVESVVIHGICIGSAAGTYAVTSPDCPPCVSAMVTEGMFIRFGESMKNHLIERKKNIFPVLQCIDFWIKKYTGHSMMKGPIDFVDKIKIPILMFQSKEDKYSTPHNAEKLFLACGSKTKKLVMFDKGGHSMIRINNEEKYDNEIKAFLSQIKTKETV